MIPRGWPGQARERASLGAVRLSRGLDIALQVVMRGHELTISEMA